MLRVHLTLIAAVMMGFFGFRQELATAQTQVPEESLSSGTIFLLRDNQLLELNAFSAQQQPTQVMELPLRLATSDPNADSEWTILSANMDRMRTVLYTIEVFGRDERRLPTDSRLVETNLTTQERNVLLERPGLFALVLSPNQRQMIVAYFEGDFAVSRSRSCVLDLDSGMCSSIDLYVDLNPGTWIDNQTYVVLSPFDRRIYLVDTTTLVSQQLAIPDSWFLYSVAPVPGSTTLLISARQRTDTSSTPSPILQFDFATSELSEFAYSAASVDYLSIDQWQFSPDRQYLLYGGGLKMALITFQTGHLVREFDRAFNSGWLDNSTLAVQGALDASIGGIIRLNANTGEVVQLAAPTEATGILLIP